MVAYLSRAASCAVLLCALGCSAGHGLPLEEVSGVVTRGGTPLEGVSLEFRPTTGRPSFGRTDVDGKYVLQYTDQISGAMIGDHTVQLRVPTKTPAEIPGFAEMDKEARMMVVQYNAIAYPEPITVIKGEATELNFELDDLKK